MRNYFTFIYKALFLLAFLALNANAFSQAQKFPAEFHYNSKTGRFQKGEEVTLTFLLTQIKDNAAYQTIYATLSKQDALKKVVVSTYDSANNSALCSLTLRTPPNSPYKPNYLQKLFVSIEVTQFYYDNEVVPTKELVRYFLGKEKQEQNKEK